MVMLNVAERVNERRWAGDWGPCLSCSLMCFLYGAGKPHARSGVTALSPESTKGTGFGETTNGPNGNQNHL